LLKTILKAGEKFPAFLFTFIQNYNNMDIFQELAGINQKLIQKDYVACGYQALDFSTAGAKTPTVPVNAVYAEVKIESSVVSGIVGRRLNLGNGTVLTSVVGMSVVHMDYFDIIGSDSINNFRIILTTAGTHTAHIQYYRNI